MRHGRDPYWTKARFASTCAGCKRDIRKGQPIFYFPNSRSVFCGDDRCGGQESRSFESARADEAFLCGSWQGL